jgi:hypothetical protein
LGNSCAALIAHRRGGAGWRMAGESFCKFHGPPPADVATWLTLARATLRLTGVTPPKQIGTWPSPDGPHLMAAIGF